MFGFATNETPEYMPVAIWLAHRLAERLAAVRKSGELSFLRPDGKTQVTIGYDGVVPKTVETVVLSTQHSPSVTLDELTAAITEHVIRPVLDLRRPRLVARRRHREPDRPLRDRRPAGRRRTHRPQGDRRHLRRGLPSRRRRVQRQGPVEGRPFGGVRAALGRQERGRRGARRPARGAGRLRDRPRRSPSGSTSRPSAPGTSTTPRSRPPSARSSTCVRPRSSATSTCSDRSTRRPRPTATSAASCPGSPGSSSTASRSSAPPQDSSTATV